MNPELSYEDEQLQIIIMREMNDKKIREERELKMLQDKEYEDGLREEQKRKGVFEEVTLEEMRRVRLLRFSK